MKSIEPNRPRGAAGIIVVIIVLGFMMAIASSYTTMVRTESTGSSVGIRYLQARAAALAGVGYVIGQMNATETTFVGDYKERLYFLYASTSADLTRRMTGTGIPSPYTGFTATVATQWFYVKSQTAPYVGQIPISTQFKVTSYPNGAGPATSTFIKSIGRVLDLDPENPAVILGTWTAQILARIAIDPVGKTIAVDGWRTMPVEESEIATGAFFTEAQKW